MSGYPGDDEGTGIRAGSDKNKGLQSLVLPAHPALRTTTTVAAWSRRVRDILMKNGYGHLIALATKSMPDLTASERQQLSALSGALLSSSKEKASPISQLAMSTPMEYIYCQMLSMQQIRDLVDDTLSHVYPTPIFDHYYKEKHLDLPCGMLSKHNCLAAETRKLCCWTHWSP